MGQALKSLLFIDKKSQLTNPHDHTSSQKATSEPTNSYKSLGLADLGSTKNDVLPKKNHQNHPSASSRAWNGACGRGLSASDGERNPARKPVEVGKLPHYVPRVLFHPRRLIVWDF